MAADLHIHVWDAAAGERMKGEGFHSLESALRAFHGGTTISNMERQSRMYGILADTPQIWIGEASWLKAAVLEDSDTYVPSPVGKVSELIGETAELTQDLAKQIVDALSLKNTTDYRVAKAEEVRKFLDEHIGSRIFQISW